MCLPSPHISPHPTRLGCPRAPALGAQLQALNLHWSSILHMVMYISAIFSYHRTLAFSI